MAGGIIGTGNHPKSLWPGIHAHFGRIYDQHEEEWSKIFDVKTSTQHYEEDVQITGFGLVPVKPEGRSVEFTSETQGWLKRYTHIVYGMGYIVTREEEDDNLYEKVSKTRSGSLAFAMRQTEENVCANVLNRATDTNYTGGDGSVLMVGTHTSKAGSWSNILSPAADLSETALEDLIIMVYGAKDDMGLQIKLMPQSLIVPKEEWFEANRILQSVLQNDTALNAQNVLKSTNALPGGVVMNHYLTDTDAFFIKTNCMNGMTYFLRRGYEFTVDSDFSSENMLAKATKRYSVGWTDWRSLYGSPGV